MFGTDEIGGSNKSDPDQTMKNDDHEEVKGDEIHGATDANGGGKLREEKKVEEGLTGQIEEVEIGNELGLDSNLDAKADDLMENNEGISPPQHTDPLQSPHVVIPESVVDSESSSNMPFKTNRASDLLMAVSLGAEENKIKINELASSAIDELLRKAVEGEPLWQRSVDGEVEFLNEGEYIREFRAFDATFREILRMIEVGDPQYLRQRKHLLEQEAAEWDILQTEASREIGFLNVNATSIVECLMDMNQWSSAFSKIVSKATLLRVLSIGPVVGDYNATLQVIRAEFHMPTPFVPVRECQFARYCKRLGPSAWGVVDVSLENLFPYPVVKFQRRPSGCLIQEMPNGVSKVTWVEHVEVNNCLVRKAFKPLVASGFAFGARRWIAILNQHFEGISTLNSGKPISVDGELICQSGKQSLLAVAERMMRKFSLDLSASSDNLWMAFPIVGADDFKMMTKSIGHSSGFPTTTVAFTHSLWLPAPPNRVFDFLRHEDCRNKWDLLSRDLEIEELMHIIKGENQENSISLMKTVCDQTQREILYLQESYRDPTASYVVYAPFDLYSMRAVLNGGNPDDMNILPSGFVIHPDKLVMNDGDHDHDHDGGGCILTLAFHIVDTSSMTNSISPESVDTIFRILVETAYLIKAAVLYDD